jgi:hypothetical protein
MKQVGGVFVFNKFLFCAVGVGIDNESFTLLVFSVL